MTQYVAVKFRTADTRTYTYIWDGEPLNEGDTVRVEDRSGDGWKKVYVVSTTDEAPSFACKPILGKHVDEPDPDLITGCADDQAFAGVSPEAARDALDSPLAF